MIIHKNPTIAFNTLFGKVQIRSPYLWLHGVSCSKPLRDDMRIYHNSRSEAVIRALSDFGIEESFANAAIRFKEHYHYDIGPSAVAISTKKTAKQAMEFIEDKSHLMDHLYDTAEELGIKKKDRPAWVNLRLKDISAGKNDAALKELGFPRYHFIHVQSCIHGYLQISSPGYCQGSGKL